jgi:hypothetical protein
MQIFSNVRVCRFFFLEKAAPCCYEIAEIFFPALFFPSFLHCWKCAENMGKCARAKCELPNQRFELLFVFFFGLDVVVFEEALAGFGSIERAKARKCVFHVFFPLRDCFSA